MASSRQLALAIFLVFFSQLGLGPFGPHIRDSSRVLFWMLTCLSLANSLFRPSTFHSLIVLFSGDCCKAGPALLLNNLAHQKYRYDSVPRVVYYFIAQTRTLYLSTKYNSPKFVSLRPENNSLGTYSILPLQRKILGTKWRNLRNRIQAKKSAKKGRLTSSQQGLTN